MSRVGKTRELCGDKFVQLSGDDFTGLDFVEAGGHGVISVTNNIAAAEMAKMMKLALSGQFEEARIINNRLMPLHKKLFVEANPIPVKWAARELGLIDCGVMRLPMTELSEPERPVVLQALKESGLL